MPSVSKLRPLPLLLIGSYMAFAPSLELSTVARLVIIHVILIFSANIFFKTKGKELEPKWLYAGGFAFFYILMACLFYFFA